MTESGFIGGYRVIRLLGKGGMGEVYEVVDAEDRHWALKIFVVEAGQSDFLRRRFLSEGRLLAKLSHPRLVHVHDVGVEAGTGRPYYTMDCVLDARGESVTLEDLRRRGEVTEERAWQWYEDLRAAVQYCHEQGVIHRDIKLSNVLVDAEGHAVLSDFGVSRIFSPEIRSELEVTTTMVEGATTGTRPIMGTYWYLAPSLRNGGEASAETDWYALGVLFYRLLTGLWYEPGTEALDLLSPYDDRWRTLLSELLCEDVRAKSPGKRRFPWWTLALVGGVLLGGLGIWMLRGLTTTAQTAVEGRSEETSTNAVALVFDAQTRFEFRRCPSGRGVLKHDGVVVPHDYWLGCTPVTRREWFAVRGEPLVTWEGGTNAPMTYVSRAEVDDFCARLNRRFASQIPKGCEIRLPTLAEWIMAYRHGGVVTGDPKSTAYRQTHLDKGWYGQGLNGEAKFANMFDYYVQRGIPVPDKHRIWPDFPPRTINPGSDEWARYSSRVVPVAVGQKPANGLGLHDMFGNCFERVYDRGGYHLKFYGETEYGMRVVEDRLFSSFAPCVTNPVERSGTLPLMVGNYMAPDIPPDQVWASHFEKLPHLGFRLCIGPHLPDASAQH